MRAEQVDPDGRTGRMLFSLANISVTILDQNDNAPKFEKALYPATFMENVVRGTKILRVRPRYEAPTYQGGKAMAKENTILRIRVVVTNIKILRVRLKTTKYVGKVV